ncbi:MAG: hypothetical protein ACOZCP_09100 [Pseudomonadota bacterium]
MAFNPSKPGGRESSEIEREHLEKWWRATLDYLRAPLEGVASGNDPVWDGPPWPHQSAARDNDGSEVALLSRTHRILLRFVARAIRKDENPLKALETAIGFHVSFIVRHPDIPRRLLTWFLKTDDLQARMRVQGVITHYQLRLSRLVARAIDRGFIGPSVEPDAAAGLLIGLIQGQALTAGPGLRRPETLLAQVLTCNTLPEILHK